MLRLNPIWIFLTFFSLPTFGSAEMHRFESWYPRYSSPLSNLTEGICSTEYKIYQSGSLRVAEAYKPLLGWGVDSSVMPLLDCLLNQTPEIYKFVMSSSQVLMGLMPTLFVNLGPDFHQLAILLVHGNHHLLYALLRLGAPSLIFDNTVGFRELIPAISKSKDRLSREQLWGPNIYTRVAEYILASAAVGNMFHLSIELGVKAAFSFAQSGLFMVPLWIVLGLCIQILGALILIFARPSNGFWSALLSLSLLEWFRKRQEGKGYTEIENDSRDCSKTEVFLSWLAKALSYIVLLYATLVLSSILFISARDAAMIVGRVFASATVCRIITEYEICLLQTALDKA